MKGTKTLGLEREIDKEWSVLLFLLSSADANLIKGWGFVGNEGKR